MRIRKANLRRRRAMMRAQRRREPALQAAFRRLGEAMLKALDPWRGFRIALEQLGEGLKANQGGPIYAGFDLAKGPDHSAEYVISREAMDRFSFADLPAAPSEIHSVRVLCRLPRKEP